MYLHLEYVQQEFTMIDSNFLQLPSKRMVGVSVERASELGNA